MRRISQDKPVNASRRLRPFGPYLYQVKCLKQASARSELLTSHSHVSKLSPGHISCQMTHRHECYNNRGLFQATEFWDYCYMTVDNWHTSAEANKFLVDFWGQINIKKISSQKIRDISLKPQWLDFCTSEMLPSSLTFLGSMFSYQDLQLLCVALNALWHQHIELSGAMPSSYLAILSI